MVTATVQKWSNSQGVRLPKPVLDEANVRVGDAVRVSVESGNIVIAPVRRPIEIPDIDSLFASYRGGFIPREDGFASPSGSERR